MQYIGQQQLLMLLLMVGTELDQLQCGVRKIVPRIADRRFDMLTIFENTRQRRSR